MKTDKPPKKAQQATREQEMKGDGRFEVFISSKVSPQCATLWLFVSLSLFSLSLIYPPSADSSLDLLCANRDLCSDSVGSPLQ